MEADNGYDPLPKFTYLDPQDIRKGLLVWIDIAVAATANCTDVAYYAGT